MGSVGNLGCKFLLGFFEASKWFRFLRFGVLFTSGTTSPVEPQGFL